jgi:hypothetical protein
MNNVRPVAGVDGSNYSYDINLNAVNKSLSHQRSGSYDYENNPKSIYMNKSNVSNQRTAVGNQNAGNNIIMEMDAENNEDESYYIS